MIILFILLLIIVIGALIVYQRLCRIVENPFILVYKFGKMGSGKTTDIVAECLEDIRTGWIPYTTVKDIPGTYYFDAADFGLVSFPPYSHIHIDEVGSLFPSRGFKTFPKTTAEFFRLARQNKCKITLYSQATNDADKIIRNLCHEYWQLDRWFTLWTRSRKVIKAVSIGTDGDGNGSFVDTYEYESWLAGGVKLRFILRYVDLFESYAPKPLPRVNAKEIPQDEAFFNALTWRWYPRKVRSALSNFFTGMKSAFSKKSIE